MKCRSQLKQRPFDAERLVLFSFSQSAALAHFENGLVSNLKRRRARLGAPAAAKVGLGTSLLSRRRRHMECEGNLVARPLHRLICINHRAWPSQTRPGGIIGDERNRSSSY